MNPNNNTDLVGLTYAIAILGGISALGYLLDKMILPRQAETIRDALAHMWFRISDSKVHELDVTMARLFLRTEKALFGDRLISLRMFFVTFLISSSLTIFGLLVGDTIYENFQYALYYLRDHRIEVLIPINLLFDLATVLVTVSLVRLFVKYQHSAYRIVFLIVDLSIAVGFAALCFTVSQTAEFSSSWSNLNFQPIYFEYYYQLMTEPYRWTAVQEGADVHFAANFFYANTTLLPTAAYIIILLLLFFSLVVYRLLRICTLQVLELSVDTEKSAFFYTAVLLGILTTGGKILLELVRFGKSLVI